MTGNHMPRLRESALSRFGDDWAAALEQGTELKRTMERLTAGMHVLAEHGSFQTLVFPDEVVQEWWVAFQEAHGDMFPRAPMDAPPRMQHEDVIVAERAA